MRPCEDWHRKIVRVLDNEAGDEDERGVAEHLHVCASCREFHDKFARIRGEFRSVAEPRVPAGIRQNLVKEVKADVGMQTRRKSYLSAAAVLIAGIAFLGGRLSAPRILPMSADIARPPTTEPGGITVPNELVVWLDAARLFKRLGMEERMVRAFDNAGELLPSDAVDEINMTGQAFSFDSNSEEIFKDQNKHSILAEFFSPQESIGSISGIIAQSFGDYYYENEMD